MPKPKFLTLNGTEVECTARRRLDDERGGETVRAYARNLRSTLTPGKRNWQFTTRPMYHPEHEAIRALAANGAHLAVGGSALGFPGAGSITCVVEVSEQETLLDVADDVYGWQSPLLLTVREV